MQALRDLWRWFLVNLWYAKPDETEPVVAEAVEEAVADPDEEHEGWWDTADNDKRIVDLIEMPLDEQPGTVSPVRPPDVKRAASELIVEAMKRVGVPVNPDAAYRDEGACAEVPRKDLTVHLLFDADGRGEMKETRYAGADIIISPVSNFPLRPPVVTNV